MFIQCKQAEYFEDKKKTVNGRNVDQVDSTENYMVSVEQESAHWNHWQVTLFTVCA